MSSESEKKHDHQHGHSHDHGHAHYHGVVDPSLLSSKRGIDAVKLSLLCLLGTAVVQVVVVVISGSVALLADTVHNIGDACTAIPLWIAFALGQRQATRRFTYGYGRLEDIAGLIIIGIVLISAAITGYESVDRLFHPRPITHIGAVIFAAVIGFFGNEVVARIRINAGREIGSAALVADGGHARIDGLTSLSVLVGAVAVYAGVPVADPIVGLLITLAILHIVWDMSKSIFTRLLDGVDPEMIDAIEDVLRDCDDVVDVTEVRARWLGHRLHAEVNIAVESSLPVEAAHTVAMAAHDKLLTQIPFLSDATIHVDPANASGEQFHHAHESVSDNG